MRRERMVRLIVLRNCMQPTLPADGVEALRERRRSYRSKTTMNRVRILCELS